MPVAFLAVSVANMQFIPKLMDLVVSGHDENGSWLDSCGDMDSPTTFRGLLSDSISSVTWDHINITDPTILIFIHDGKGIVPMPDIITRYAGFILAKKLPGALKNTLYILPSLLSLRVNRRSVKNDVFVRFLSRRVLRSSWK